MTESNGVPAGTERTASADDARFRNLLEAAPDAIVIVDAAGKIAIVNQQAEALFGYRRDELHGRPIELLIPARFHHRHVADRQGYIAAPHTRPMGVGLELYGQRKDGGEFPVEVSLSPLDSDGQLLITSIVRDISRRRQIEAIVREQDQRLRALLEGVRDYAIFMLDPDGRIASWNAGAERILGYQADEMLGQHFSRFYPPEAVATGAPERELQAARDEGYVHDIGVRVRKDGSRFWSEVVLTALRDEHGGLQGFAKVTQDITARLESERELQHAKEEAEQANLAKSEFLSRMSHELRTPLNAVLGFAQLLEFDPLEPQQQKNVERILKAGRHLLELINEVLDIARIESGRLPLSPEPVRLREVVTETLDLVRPLAAEHEISVSLAGDAEIDGRFVLADRQRLKQILLNLLSNAVKYNRDQGSVSVVCSAPAAGRLRISVRDTGRGIPAAKLSRLFQPFDRLGAETTEVEGTGLGLALSRRLAEAMGGTIGVESTIGAGSVFHIELIEAADPLLQQTFAAPAGEPRPEPSGRTQRVLYIEDNLSNLELVEQILERWPGVGSLAAMQGRLGLDLAFQHRPDVILLDLHLPDMNGLDVLQVLKANPETAAIPVVILSADATPGQVERLLTAGAHAYLTKPLDVAEFLTVVADALQRHAGSREG
ncbi:MAG TPA: PAS domain S-box protein [Dehalococcoidia bacterium]|nr:PAS domain S-box protein [Dehalococcoidia bacterium]